MKNSKMRYKVWDKLTKNLEEGEFLPKWALALRTFLFPISTISSFIYSKASPFDVYTGTWTIHGTKFSDELFMAMSGNMGEDWYKFVKTQNGALSVHKYYTAPISINDAMPTSRDCDEDGQCWWFNPGNPAMSNPHIATSSWRLTRIIAGKPMGTHWLPYTRICIPTPLEVE
jgi:hypothetical protein